jgi:hypothetical protein
MKKSVERRETEIFLTPEDLKKIPKEAGEKEVLNVNDPTGKFEKFNFTYMTDRVKKLLEILNGNAPISMYYSFTKTTTKPSTISPPIGSLRTWGEKPSIFIETYGGEKEERRHQERCQQILDWLEKYGIFITERDYRCELFYTDDCDERSK